MAGRGGARPGAGRKRGALSKKTTEVAQRAAETGLTPLEWLLKVMRDHKKPLGMRMDAAKAAAPYMHPRLSTVELNLRDLDEQDLRDAAQ